ncbi:MAG: hypothetical protein CVU54_16355 [Deltaproteobacteria bacterium HGW-Deltaproteobacteria-12]|jgi:LysM repeat protein|nr:MAG: hypothetical protein CVU54_16355 [Deltaproteobacteria bacterium HGW-Deltaproteobacteria-12]
MIKRDTLVIIAVFMLAAFLCQPSWAKEDTAQISLKKTAVSKQNVRLYKVKKGDVISAIIRKMPGITESDIPDNYRIIRQLNPEIEDLNKLYAGQILKLPGKSSSAAATNANAPAGTKTYRIKKGDSLITIIERELKIRTEHLKTVKLIKSMNPRISNANKIYAGQVIKLPVKTDAGQELNIAEQVKVIPAESQPQPQEATKIKENIAMSPAVKLAVIKQILTQMNASVLSSGNYYLPIAKTGQVTIDCAKIPVIEFDDKTTVFLDWENRLHDNLKKLIRENWKNFSIVKVDKKDDVIAILRKIIAATKDYSMTKRDTPLSTGSVLPVEVVVDWQIAKTDSRQNRTSIQALRFVPENNSLLPKAIKNYARKNGLIITEIDAEKGLAGRPEEIYSLSPLPVFPATTAKDFTHALVTHLGFTANKDADVKVFNVEKDGFNLSIKSDVLIEHADKKYIIYSRSLPEQFINIFKQRGYGLISVDSSDSPKIIMEKILPALAIPSTYGYFTFSGVDKNQAPFTFGFTGMKIKTDRDLYVVDFAIDDGLRGLISELWQAGFARY